MALDYTSPSRKKNIPAKFKQEMPRRSINSIENTSPEQAKMSPIKKSTFYGGYKPKYVLEEKTNDLNFDLKNKMILETPPQKLKVTKKKKELTKSAPSFRSKTYGINKGVSHAIKKPKINPKKKEQKPKSGKYCFSYLHFLLIFKTKNIDFFKRIS